MNCRLACLLLAVCLAASGLAAQENPAAPPAKSSPPGAASSADIAAAKASHKVWVNLETGVYHKGGRWYGKTRNGKFMSEDDARKTGYKAAKRD